MNVDIFSRRDGFTMAGRRNGNTNHARKRKVQKEPFSYKNLTDKQKKLVKWGGAAIVAVIIILAVLGSYDLLPHFDGSLHIIGGELKGAQPNDIILNTQTREDPRYFNLGSVEVPEGYYNDDDFHTIISTSDAVDYSQSYCYRPEDKAQPLQIVVVQGSASSIDERIKAISGQYSDPEAYVTSERIDAVSPVKGNKYSAIHATSVETETDIDEQGNVTREYYSTVAVAYVDVDSGSRCIMVYMSFKADTKAQIPTDETIRACIEQMVDTVTVK